ncbi:aKG-HExxH-type peptide beta-hydroxylase [Kitasatospora phosalacinea]|uniref:HEXXH motif-containing putative peptide modification protein n=1 Tax=Kitasatospora phosalacinea TaxID=2065 RepID=A0ABW6GMF5_9ACTN
MTTETVEASDYFSAAPDPEKALERRTRMHRQLVKDLGTYVRVASKVYPGAAANARTALSALDPAQRLAPLLYTIHYDLKNGLVAQDAGAVCEGLNALAFAVEAGRHVDRGFAVERIRGDAVDTAIMDLVINGDGPRDEFGRPAEMTGPDAASMAQALAWAEECLPILAEVDPPLFGEFETFVSRLRLFAGTGVRGVTSVRTFGLISLRVPDREEAAQGPLYFLDHVTHETSHLSLHSLMNVDPLIENAWEKRFAAPIRPDARPLYGIYHATFVLSRITRVFARAAASLGGAEAVRLRDVQHDRFWKGYRTVSEHAELTPAGRQVLASCRATVEEAMA